MRQAGRSDPDYMAYRENAGEPLYDLFRDPRHAIPISLLPKRIGVDAIIMFQDILTPLTPMGGDFLFVPGPVLETPIRSAEAIGELRPIDPARDLPFVGETIGGLLDEMNNELPLLGFAGAPFTLAAFLIEGTSPPDGMPATIELARNEPEAFSSLMDKLTDMTIAYLNYQFDMGVHAVQLFESIGDQIPEPLYRAYAQPSHEKIFRALNPEKPAILFVRESPYPELMMQSGAAVISLGSGVSLANLRKSAPEHLAFQGNVDNRILADQDGDAVEKAVLACLNETGGKSHILNLGHGILPRTPFENVRRFVEVCHRFNPDGG